MERVVLCVDNYDPDNAAAALAADKLLNLSAIIVNGRFAHPDPNAHLADKDDAFSESEHLSCTRRMAGLIARSGSTTPVFKGLIAKASIIPHDMFWPDAVFDVRNDNKNQQPFAGDMDDAISFLEKSDGTMHVIGAGPMTEVAALMDSQAIYNKLGTITMQFGVFSWGGKKAVQTASGRKVQFNYGCDIEAGNKVLDKWPGELYVVPTDITKQPDVAIPDLETLMRMPINTELKEVYAVAHPQITARTGGRIYIHDLHPTFLMADLLRRSDWYPNCKDAEDNRLWYVGNYLVEKIGHNALRPTTDPARAGELELIRHTKGKSAEIDDSKHRIVIGTSHRADIQKALSQTEPSFDRGYPSSFFETTIAALRS
ncbi:MAG TPA: hypothetical protein VK983_00965 [Candidatus Limnocylindrales bacterium]|nr:hypothetical protein [Candidatus Limnocylindrales bacterium]